MFTIHFPAVPVLPGAANVPCQPFMVNLFNPTLMKFGTVRVCTVEPKVITPSCNCSKLEVVSVKPPDRNSPPFNCSLLTSGILPAAPN